MRTLCLQAFAALVAASQVCVADSSGPALASYYDRHMAIIEGSAFGWTGSSPPKRMLDGVKQVGVTKDSYLALRTDGSLLRWRNDAREAVQVMTGIKSFAAGQTGVFAIDANNGLWHVGSASKPPLVSKDVVAGAVGDGADYYITADGGLHVKGNAHRGQYGDGRLVPTTGFVQTAADATDVKAHTGHAIYLARNGDVFGTGGNIYGPLSTHGLGDKATKWGKIFDGATGIATGASHSAAIRQDGSLWLWGAGYGTAPLKILDNVAVVAAGNSETIALTADGALWQWDAGTKPRRLKLAPQ